MLFTLICICKRTYVDELKHIYIIVRGHMLMKHSYLTGCYLHWFVRGHMLMRKHSYLTGCYLYWFVRGHMLMKKHIYITGGIFTLICKRTYVD